MKEGKKQRKDHFLSHSDEEKSDAAYLRKVKILRFVQRCMFFLPINDKRVTLYCNQRRGFTCNLKYIALELKKRYGEEIELIWITEHPESCYNAEKAGCIIVGANHWKHWLYQLTSKAVIVNDSFHEAVIIRRNQLTINTWHAGINYKCIGTRNLVFRNPYHRELFKLRNKQPDVFLSGSRFFTDNTSFSFEYDSSVFMPSGLPRNDILFSDCTHLNNMIRSKYKINNSDRIVLYAPTFRKELNESIHGLDFEELSNCLSRRFGGNWVVLYRRHYFIDREINRGTDGAIDVSDYDDMNELLAVSDVLISDYSSCLWDFSMMKRPAFVYATDIGDYCCRDRSFAYAIDKWPYPIACDNNQLKDCIAGFDIDDYQKRIVEHHKDAGNYDDGCASERVADLIENFCVYNK